MLLGLMQSRLLRTLSPWKQLAGRDKRLKRALKPKPLPLSLELLEDRLNPSPFDPTGALGALTLNSGDSIAFNTTTGQYSIDGGAWQSGGVLDPSQTTMLFNFTTINLASGSTVTATGSNALGLLASSNVVINTNLDFSGQAGGNGADGYGSIGGGGGGGGGAGGAFIIDTSGGSIDDSGEVNVMGGTPGQAGTGWLTGPNSGGAGGAGGVAGVGGGSGGDGGGSIDGGKGGNGGNASHAGGGGGGGGGGIVSGGFGNGGSGSKEGDNQGSPGIAGNNAGTQPGQGGPGGGGGADYLNNPSGGNGGNGSGTYGQAGDNGGDAPKSNTYTDPAGGGGGGGGGADAEPGKKGAKPGGSSTGGKGAVGGSVGGQPGTYVAAEGAGGGGAMMFVASNGVTLTGQVTRGDGSAVVYGNLLSGTGNFTDGVPNIDTYADWESLSASDYYLGGGGGGGGGGGAGQVIGTPTHTTKTVGGLSATSPGTGMYTNAGALTLTSSPLPNNQSAIPSPAQVASSYPSGGPVVTGTDLSQLLSILGSPSAGWPSMPTIPISNGSVNTSSSAQLLASNMAGWPGMSLAQKEQIVPHSDELEHQVLDAVLADLAADPLASVLLTPA